MEAFNEAVGAGGTVHLNILIAKESTLYDNAENILTLLSIKNPKTTAIVRQMDFVLPDFENSGQVSRLVIDARLFVDGSDFGFVHADFTSTMHYTT